MPPRCRAPTNGLLLDLLCAALRQPSRQCVYQTLALTSRRRHASSSSSPPPPPPPPSSSSSSSPPPDKPPALPGALAAAATAAAGAQIPMRMLLDRNPENVSTISRIPIPAGTRGEKFVPQP